MTDSGQAAPNDVIQPEGAPGDRPIELQLDDSATAKLYSSTSRVWGSAEEIYLDFASGIQAAGENKALLKIDQRVVLSPWGAKRLALALNQVVANYEKMYGPLEIDQRKRLLSGAASSAE